MADDIVKKNESKLQVLLVPFIERGYQTTELLIKLLELCRIEGIVVTTTLSNLEHIISKTRQKVEINIQNILTQNLTSEQKDLLDNTLKMTKDKYLSDFGWLKKNIGKTSVSSFHEILKKLHYLEKFYFIPEDLDIPIAKVKEFINLGYKPTLITSDSNHFGNFPYTDKIYNFELIENINIFFEDIYIQQCKIGQLF